MLQNLSRLIHAIFTVFAVFVAITRRRAILARKIVCVCSDVPVGHHPLAKWAEWLRASPASDRDPGLNASPVEEVTA